MAFVHAGVWTEEDLVALPEERHFELLEGALIVNPTPTVRHQQASRVIANLLEHAAPPDLLAVEAVGVRVPDGVFVPDVLVADRQVALADRSGLLDAGIVRLVVEIVSPSSRSMDRLTKPSLYAGAGIEHYWRVELDGGPAVYAYRLDGQEYVAVAEGGPGQPLRLDRPFPVTVDPAALG